MKNKFENTNYAVIKISTSYSNIMDLDKAASRSEDLTSMGINHTVLPVNLIALEYEALVKESDYDNNDYPHIVFNDIVTETQEDFDVDFHIWALNNCDEKNEILTGDWQKYFKTEVEALTQEIKDNGDMLTFDFQDGDGYGFARREELVLKIEDKIYIFQI